MIKYFCIALLSLLAFSCKKSKVSNCEGFDASGCNIQCLIYNYYFEFKVVDKTTGADLVFGANPRYSTADIKLYADAAHTVPVPLTADNSRKVFSTGFGTQQMYLVIAGTTSYQLHATYKPMECCAARVKDLRINNQSLCVCCSDVINLPVN